LSNFNMQTHRHKLREQSKKKKEKRLSCKNEFDMRDLTPHNAINLIINPDSSIKYR